MIATLFAHQWRRHRLVLVLVPLGVFAFEWMISRIAPTPEQTQQLGAVLAFLPPQLTSAVGLDNPMSVTTRGVLMFGYAHPFVILLFGLWTVRVTAGGLAGEIGMGTMDLIASRPVSRTAVVLSVAVTAGAGIVVATTFAWAGTAVGLATRELGDVRAGEFVRVAGGLALLYAGWAGVALFVSASHRHGGSAIAILSGLMAVTFALDYIAKVWQPIHRLRYLSPFMYFEPHAIEGHRLADGGTAVLASLAVLGLAGALLAFGRRDL